MRSRNEAGLNPKTAFPKFLRTDRKARAVKTESAFIEIESAFQEVLPRLGSAAAVR
jgi:hypothetical protein